MLAGAMATAVAQNANPTVSPRETVPRDSAMVSTSAATTLPVASALAALQGLPVARVEFEGVRLDPPVLAHLKQLVAPMEGRPLDRQQVAKSVRELYATGRFADLQVEAQKTSQNQVQLVFIATENLFIGSVVVEGAPKRPAASHFAGV